MTHRSGASSLVEALSGLFRGETEAAERPRQRLGRRKHRDVIKDVSGRTAGRLMDRGPVAVA